MKNNPDAKIQIHENTCNIGTAEYNLGLGEQQAIRANGYLEGLGVNSARTFTISFGMEKPMIPNSGEANRSRNGTYKILGRTPLGEGFSQNMHTGKLILLRDFAYAWQGIGRLELAFRSG
jgi:hypothetical protein